MATLREAQKAQTRRLLLDSALALFESRDIFTTADNAPLASVVERGERALVQAWLERKFDQWAVAGPHLTATYQAAAIDPESQASLDAWLEDVAGAIQEGLDRADRFDAETRRIRAVLAFGQLEYLCRRWLKVGWVVDREICLQTLTDSWCHLLTQSPSAD